jgi:hypothetical protein
VTLFQSPTASTNATLTFTANKVIVGDGQPIGVAIDLAGSNPNSGVEPTFARFANSNGAAGCFPTQPERS